MVKSSTLILALAGALSAHALTFSVDDEAARQAASQWLQVVDAGNYKDAALMLSDYVRASRDWPNYLATQRAPFGRARNRQIAETKHAAVVEGDPQTRKHVIMRFKSSFEKGIAIEEIVVAKAGCCWEALNYSITAAGSR